MISLPVDWTIIDNHVQRGDNRIPSSIELILKLMNKLPLNNNEYPIQDEWEKTAVELQRRGKKDECYNRGFGDILPIINQFNLGVVFRVGSQKDDMHTVNEKIELIEKNVENGKFVIVSLRRGNEPPHCHVVYQINGELKAFTKGWSGKETFISDLLGSEYHLGDSDILIYS